ncbi:MAG: Fe-S cluster assembly protein SufB, partial [Pseudomonadota bacterium]
MSDCCGFEEPHEHGADGEVLVKDTIDAGTVAAAKALESENYTAGFSTDIEMDMAPKGLNEDIVRFISSKKNEPEWLLDWRLKAFERWQTMDEPNWAMVRYPAIDYQAYHYYAAPKAGAKYDSIDDVPKEILETYEKLGIPLREAEVLLGVAGASETAAEARETPRVAVDAVFDSVSVATTFKKELEKAGVIFMSISEAVHEHPELVKKYLGSVVPQSDNFFATLNSAVFSDGTFVYIPKGVRCPMELSTYFRMNAENTGQFERTLI